MNTFPNLYHKCSSFAKGKNFPILEIPRSKNIVGWKFTYNIVTLETSDASDFLLLFDCAPLLTHQWLCCDRKGPWPNSSNGMIYSFFNRLLRIPLYAWWDPPRPSIHKVIHYLPFNQANLRLCVSSVGCFFYNIR